MPVPIVRVEDYVRYPQYGSPVTVEEVSATEYRADGKIPGVDGESGSGELTIVVGGYTGEQTTAEEQIEQFVSTLRAVGYRGDCVGFVWAPSDIREWKLLQMSASLAGPRLAQFIEDYKKETGGDTLRILTHSLGARVVMEALKSLQKRSILTDVESVTILAGSVGVSEVIGQYKTPVEHRAEQVDSFYSYRDTVLTEVNEKQPWIMPMGLTSIDDYAEVDTPRTITEFPSPVSRHREYSRNEAVADRIFAEWGRPGMEGGEEEGSSDGSEDSGSTTDDSAQGTAQGTSFYNRVLTAIQRWFDFV